MRTFTLSDDTILLKLWDKLHIDVDPLLTPSIKDLENNPPPDISGNWLRAARAIECRNHPERPGLQSPTNPRGSRSEVVPPDIDRAKSTELGIEVAKPLPWNITKGEKATSFTGSGAGSIHDHHSGISYKGMVDGKHHYFYKTTRSIKRAFSSALVEKIYQKLGRDKITTAMYGVIIVEQDANKNVTQLTSVVTCSDGNDPDLPKRFKEISVWRRAEPTPA